MKVKTEFKELYTENALGKKKERKPYKIKNNNNNNRKQSCNLKNSTLKLAKYRTSIKIPTKA